MAFRRITDPNPSQLATSINAFNATPTASWFGLNVQKYSNGRYEFTAVQKTGLVALIVRAAVGKNENEVLTVLSAIEPSISTVTDFVITQFPNGQFFGVIAGN